MPNFNMTTRLGVQFPLRKCWLRAHTPITVMS